MSSSEPQLLEQCPRCEYLLHGLPEQHRCPECGLEIDRRWQVMAGKTTRHKPSKFLVVLLSLAFVNNSIRMFFGSPPLHWKFGIPFAVVIGLLLWVLLKKTSRFLAAGPEGLVVYRGGNRLKRYAWSQVGRAEYTILRKGVSIPVGSKRLFLSDMLFFNCSLFEAEQCASEINAYPRPHTPSPQSKPQA